MDLDTSSPIISTYSRRQALDDGVLIALAPATCREAGFRLPIAATARLYNEVVTVPPNCEGLQDVAGRLWDLLWMLRQAITGHIAADRSPGPGGIGELLTFQLHVMTDSCQTGTPPLYTVRAVSGPGDDGEPVITLMHPDED